MNTSWRFAELAEYVGVDSCGYSVPFFDFRSHRDTLNRWAASKGPEELDSYRATKNQNSIDGLPAFSRNA